MLAAKFLDKTEVGKKIFTFRWQTESKLNFTPGQFTRIKLEHDSPDDRGERRFFTISASPTEQYPAITTKFSTPSSTFKKTLFNLQPGAALELAEPRGDFVLPDDAKRPLVFVAGGIGVTPYRSIIKFLTDTNASRPIHLIYAASSDAEILWHDLFDDQPWLKTTYIVDKPQGSWSGETGRLDGTRIKELAGGFDNKLFYFSGPEPMVEALVRQLIDIGLPTAQIKTDYFPGYDVI